MDLIIIQMSIFNMEHKFLIGVSMACHRGTTVRGRGGDVWIGRET